MRCSLTRCAAASVAAGPVCSTGSSRHHELGRNMPHRFDTQEYIMLSYAL